MQSNYRIETRFYDYVGGRSESSEWYRREYGSFNPVHKRVVRVKIEKIRSRIIKTNDVYYIIVASESDSYQRDAGSDILDSKSQSSYVNPESTTIGSNAIIFTTSAEVKVHNSEIPGSKGYTMNTQYANQFVGWNHNGRSINDSYATDTSKSITVQNGTVLLVETTKNFATGFIVHQSDIKAAIQAHPNAQIFYEGQKVEFKSSKDEKGTNIGTKTSVSDVRTSKTSVVISSNRLGDSKEIKESSSRVQVSELQYLLAQLYNALTLAPNLHTYKTHTESRMWVEQFKVSTYEEQILVDSKVLSDPWTAYAASKHFGTIAEYPGALYYHGKDLNGNDVYQTEDEREAWNDLVAWMDSFDPKDDNKDDETYNPEGDDQSPTGEATSTSSTPSNGPGDGWSDVSDNKGME